MIFESLNESANKGELMLVDGGMCHYHLRRDGQLTIREIISTKRGAGSLMLTRLKHVIGVTSLFAKCPAQLPSNAWYAKRGFHCERMEFTKSGNKLIHWRLNLKPRPQPNVAGIELIMTLGGNREFAQIAIDAGFKYGARLPDTVYFKPYFADQEYKNPNLTRYIEALDQHRPVVATVLDLEYEHQFDEVMKWCELASQYVQTLVVIPKVHGIIDRIPETIGGKPVRLGYSIWSRVGGTSVPCSEFGKRPVHLLGGSTKKQLTYLRLLNVVSADIDYPFMKSEKCEWYGAVANGYKAMSAFDHKERGKHVMLEAFRRSCINIMAAWRKAQVSHDLTHLPMFTRL